MSYSNVMELQPQLLFVCLVQSPKGAHHGSPLLQWILAWALTELFHLPGVSDTETEFSLCIRCGTGRKPQRMNSLF